EIRQRVDQAILQSAQVAADIRRRHQVDDRIANQLPRAVIGDVATSIHVEAGDAASRQLGRGQKNMVPSATSSNGVGVGMFEQDQSVRGKTVAPGVDRKSTRLNSSHVAISY